jgi:hypothetical protein
MSFHFGDGFDPDGVRSFSFCAFRQCSCDLNLFADQLPNIAFINRNCIGNIENVRRAGDPQRTIFSAVLLKHAAKHNFSLLHAEAVLGDGLLQLFERSCVARLHGDSGEAVLQADVYGVNAIDGFEGHAHGVCTDLSIHAEDRDLQ